MWMRADQVLSHDTMRVCLRRFGSATSTTMYAALLRIAGEERITVPELLRREGLNFGMAFEEMDGDVVVTNPGIPPATMLGGEMSDGEV